MNDTPNGQPGQPANIREELDKIPGHLLALREVLRHTRSSIENLYEQSLDGGYPELAFKEIDEALNESLEHLDNINKVIGCLDEIEVSTGHLQRSEVGIE